MLKLDFMHECLTVTHVSFGQPQIVFVCVFVCVCVCLCVTVSCLLDQHAVADYREADVKRAH